MDGDLIGLLNIPYAFLQEKTYQKVVFWLF